MSRDGVGAADDPDDQVSRNQPGAARCLQHAAERLVAEDQTLAAVGRPSVVAGEDVGVGAADADGEGLDQHGAVPRRGLPDFVEPPRVGSAGDDCGRSHGEFSSGD